MLSTLLLKQNGIREGLIEQQGTFWSVEPLTQRTAQNCAVRTLPNLLH
jgi:hypothetical protein